MVRAPQRSQKARSAAERGRAAGQLTASRQARVTPTCRPRPRCCCCWPLIAQLGTKHLPENTRDARRQAALFGQLCSTPQRERNASETAHAVATGSARHSTLPASPWMPSPLCSWTALHGRLSTTSQRASTASRIGHAAASAGERHSILPASPSTSSTLCAWPPSTAT